MARFRKMRAGGIAPPKRGLMDYLSLTPEKRHEDYRSRLNAIVRDHPDDKTTQLLYLELLLGDNQIAEAVADARSFAAQKPAPTGWRMRATHCSKPNNIQSPRKYWSRARQAIVPPVLTPISPPG